MDNFSTATTMKEEVKQKIVTMHRDTCTRRLAMEMSDFNKITKRYWRQCMLIDVLVFELLAGVSHLYNVT